MFNEGVRIEQVFRDGESKTIFDNVAKDVPFCIFVDGLPFRTLISSPNQYRELTIGHLFTEGVIKSLDDIAKESIKSDRGDIELVEPFNFNDFTLNRDRVLTTACNIDVMKNDILKEIKVHESSPPSHKLIFDIIYRLNKETPSYRATGGTHSAILSCPQTNYSVCAEDVGRHNAVDKVLGAGLIEGVWFSDCILASSGRLSGEIMLKAARAGVPDVCSVSAPLVAGINVAHQTGVRLYGFVRGKRLNKYLP